MSILNVDKIQPIGGGSTITVDATDIQASTSTIRASTFSGEVSATGIGVTSLNVAGVSTFTGNIKQTAPGTNTAKITLNNASDTTGMDVGYSESSGVGFINVGQSGSGLSIKTGGTASGNERIRITSGGQIGIGSEIPRTNFKLDVNGDLSLGESSGTDNSYIDQKQNGMLELINSGRDDHAGAIRINRMNNIAGDTTWFRDVNIYNGKGTSVMYVDGSAASVGINETSPSNALHIAGTTGTSAGGLLRLDATTGDNFILYDNTHDSTEWAVGNDSTSRGNFDFWYNNGSSYNLYLRILSTGDVSINRTSELLNAKLSINKDADQEGIAIQLNQSSGITTSFTTFNSGGSQLFSLAHDTDTTPDLLFKLKHSTDAAPVEKLRIESSGGLKFPVTGTSIPVGGILHHTNNNLYVRGGTNGLILGNQNNTTTVQIYNSYIKFETNDGTERLRIASDGKLLIDRTVSSTSGNHPALEIETICSGNEDTTFATGIDFKVDGVHKKRLAVTDGTGEGGGDWIFYRDNGTNEALRINNDGNVGINETAPSEKLQIDGDILLGGQANASESNYAIKFEYNNHQFAKIVGDGRDQSGYGDIDFYTSTGSGASNLTQRMSIRADGKIGIVDATNNGTISAALHVINSTPEIRLTNTTQPNSADCGKIRITEYANSLMGGYMHYDGNSNVLHFGVHENHDNVVSNDVNSISIDRGTGQVHLRYGGNTKLTTTSTGVTIDSGTDTLVIIRADSGGTAGLRLGGQSGSGTDQSTGYVEVHQDESHGGGMFYNGDGSPSFATGEAADYFSLYRFSSGTRHSVMRWFHSSNECNVQGDMLIDNGTSTILRVRGDSSGTAGISCGGDSGQTQCTGYLECHQDQIHGGGIFYNGDGSPAFAQDETADRVTFYRMHNGTRYEVFSTPYSDSSIRFRGDLRPAVNNNIDLGSNSVRWRDVYCNQGAFNNSDENLKQDIASLTTAEMNVAKRLSGLFKTYRWKDAVVEKGTDKARTHTGIIAQQIVTAMEAEGIDYTKYGLIGYGEWYENNEGEVIELDKAEDSNLDGYTKVGRYSVRYNELLSFIAAYNEQRFTDLESRVAALEG